MSLYISTEASVNILKEAQPLTQDLLYCLSCLPNGIDKKALENIFKQQNINESIETMKDYNQLTIKNDLVKLAPYMLKYARQNIDCKEEQLSMFKIANFYSRFLVLQYKVNLRKDLNEELLNKILTLDDRQLIMRLTKNAEDR